MAALPRTTSLLVRRSAALATRSTSSSSLRVALAQRTLTTALAPAPAPVNSPPPSPRGAHGLPSFDASNATSGNNTFAAPSWLQHGDTPDTLQARLNATLSKLLEPQQDAANVNVPRHYIARLVNETSDTEQQTALAHGAILLTVQELGMDHTDAKLAFAVARRIALAELERGTATSSIENLDMFSRIMTKVALSSETLLTAGDRAAAERSMQQLITAIKADRYALRLATQAGHSPREIVDSLIAEGHFRAAPSSQQHGSMRLLAIELFMPKLLASPSYIQHHPINAATDAALIQREIAALGRASAEAAAAATPQTVEAGKEEPAVVVDSGKPILADARRLNAILSRLKGRSFAAKLPA